MLADALYLIKGRKATIYVFSLETVVSNVFPVALLLPADHLLLLPSPWPQTFIVNFVFHISLSALYSLRLIFVSLLRVYPLKSRFILANVRLST